MPLVLAMHNVTRVFPPAVPGQSEIAVLSGVSLKLVSGTAVAIRGPSGCGKSTLLYLAGTLDRPTSGTLEILGQNPWRLSARDLAAFRNQHIGFIFRRQRSDDMQCFIHDIGQRVIMGGIIRAPQNPL